VPLPTLSKFFLFLQGLDNFLAKKKKPSVIIVPRAAGKSHFFRSSAGIIPVLKTMAASAPTTPIIYAGPGSPNYTQIFTTPIGVNVKQVQTPHGNLNIATSAQYQAAKKAALTQHSIAMQKAMLFGSPTTPKAPTFPNPTTMQNLYPSGTPFLSAVRGIKGNTGRPTFTFIDDIDEDYIDLNDPEYYTDDQIIPHDLTGYDEVKTD